MSSFERERQDLHSTIDALQEGTAVFLFFDLFCCLGADFFFNYYFLFQFRAIEIVSI